VPPGHLAAELSHNDESSCVGSVVLRLIALEEDQRMTPVEFIWQLSFRGLAVVMHS